MSAFRGVGARLSLALAVVLAIAFGVVYAVVVPLLERNLTEAKLDQLTRSAIAEARFFPSAGNFGLVDPSYQVDLDEYVDEAAVATNARVVLLNPLATRQLSVIQDSRETATAFDVSDDQVALRATLTLAVQKGIVRRGEDSYAEVAIPVASGYLETTVMLFSSPLDDTLANVELVKRRVLLAGGVALVIALLLGLGGASVFARRIRRLERAADRIAGGQLDEPVVDRGNDELGQLARTFERMRQRLAQLEHARREFIANASHELRTPLFSLGGFLELLDDEELDEPTRREFLATMQGQVERLAKLATELLDLSRLDAGQLRIDLEPVDLTGVAGALVQEFAAIALAGDHELAVEGGAEDVAALGDEQRVLQIGRVLVENALRHTPERTPVTIRVEGRSAEAILAVQDAGPGIPAEHVEHVFERFYRIDGTLASGSGLGLAIARELADAMGGSLQVETGTGRTVFALRLPATISPSERRPDARIGAAG
ncbi:MAG: sensor histidine kinase [Gaiellaceae bacterium]